MEGTCPVCQISLMPMDKGKVSDELWWEACQCSNCGKFFISHNTLRMHVDGLAEKPEKAAILSQAIRKLHGENEWVTLDQDFVKNVLENNKLPNPAEQADNLIIWLGENLNEAGETINIELQNFQAVIGTKSPIGVSFIIKSLWTRGILEGIEEESMGTPFTLMRATLSFEGWQYYEELMRGIAESRKAFMAMQYGNPELDEIVKKYFRPAVKQTGFDLVLLNDPERQEAGLMDNRMRVEIRTSRFLIADLTDGNQGAYWEAGFAEGLGKPVIYICSEEVFAKKKTHFDTEHHFTIRWDLNNPSKATEELKATIRASLPAEAKLEDD